MKRKSKEKNTIVHNINNNTIQQENTAWVKIYVGLRYFSYLNLDEYSRLNLKLGLSSKKNEWNHEDQDEKKGTIKP